MECVRLIKKMTNEIIYSKTSLIIYITRTLIYYKHFFLFTQHFPQIRRASLTHFWDCDEVLLALNPGPDSPINAAALKLVQPFICPSLLHWISMPRGDNSLIDVFTKPVCILLKICKLSQYSYFGFNKDDSAALYIYVLFKASCIFFMWYSRTREGKIFKNALKYQAVSELQAK